MNDIFPGPTQEALPERLEPDTPRLRDAAHRLRIADADVSERYFWLETIVNQIPDYIYAKDLEGRFLFANRAIVVDNNLDSLSELLGKTDFDFHPAEAAANIARTEQRVIETGEPDIGIEEMSLGAKAERWLMMSRVPLRDKIGRTIGVVGVSRDITARKSAEHLIQTQARLLEMMAEGMELPHFLEELADMIESRLPDLHAAFFVRSADGSELNLQAAPSLPDSMVDYIETVPVGPEAPGCGRAAYLGERIILTDVDFSMCLPGARETYRSAWSMPIKAADGRAIGTAAFYSPRQMEPDTHHHELIDVAIHLARIAIERRQAEDRIRFLADHDTLTGLPNRSRLDLALTKAMQKADRKGTHLAVAFLDVDNFKLVNDSLGHASGDELLKVIARRMAAFIGPKGKVVRVGGDEFVVLNAVRTDEQSMVLDRFEALRSRLSEPIPIAGMELQATCSMGIACYPEHGGTPSELLANADAAMYHAKASGRDRLAIFSREMAESARLKLARTEELRRALKQGEFELHYQPQCHLPTGTITGAEALVRWRHPVDGLLPPGAFIPLAEESGLIVPLGDWVLDEACRQARAWQVAGLPPLVVSVNVSPRQFRENGWVETVRRTLERSGLDPRFLELEITESLIMEDMQGAVARMRALSALGVTLAIDDFGTGYSSLSALKSFPVSRLKIDRSFVADIPDDADDMAITSAIISLAQKLDLSVIAEGVETEAQAVFLLKSGCTDMQGYLFGKPLCVDRFAAALKTGRIG